ncbi:MAG: hypothetical protein JXR77_13440, partial [Lentisphaeria bacterium]|nr:hypothetical protein [Lentisphaeria bacterium]
LAAALTLGSAALAGGNVPPAIDDLDGAICTMTFGATEVDLATGAVMKGKDVGVWTLAKTGPESLTITTEDDKKAVVVYPARYRNGMLIVGGLAGSPATDAVCGYLVVSGSAGKLKFKGEFGSFETGCCSAQEAMWGKITGKQNKE